MKSKGQHVLPSRGKWRVISSGSKRASGVFSTQKEAAAAARDVAKRHSTELYIHGEDGRIRARSSYAMIRILPKADDSTK